VSAEFGENKAEGSHGIVQSDKWAFDSKCISETLTFCEKINANNGAAYQVSRVLWLVHRSYNDIVLCAEFVLLNNMAG
jgi:hypothetical protein